MDTANAAGLSRLHTLAFPGAGTNPSPHKDHKDTRTRIMRSRRQQLPPATPRPVGRASAALAAALLLGPGLAACSDDATPQDGTEATQEPADSDAENGAADGEETDDGDDATVEPLAGEPSTEDVAADPQRGSLAVTEVRVGSHEGFDRLVLELDGEGSAGWYVGYAPDGQATAQGSGEPIDVAGDAVLEVAIRGVAYPGDLPEGIQPWDGQRLDGPEGGVIVEVVEDTLFEGLHTFPVGTTGEQPFLVERFQDPQRVVIDIFHEAGQ